ncbi:hypothetical protein KOW79_005459 [Hemibagrus wyckioides]|uniref:Uncharacterized protein n=1 Tax=Hemibagrus wyckioides TaxID=337641 RepID=A0A9D3SQ95_9TELE|nr:hypothetical protein KOW79_005459 [Hemibagrus wyckioides]
MTTTKPMAEPEGRVMSTNKPEGGPRYTMKQVQRVMFSAKQGGRGMSSAEQHLKQNQEAFPVQEEETTCCKAAIQRKSYLLSVRTICKAKADTKIQAVPFNLSHGHFLTCS